MVSNTLKTYHSKAVFRVDEKTLGFLIGKDTNFRMDSETGLYEIQLVSFKAKAYEGESHSSGNA